MLKLCQSNHVYSCRPSAPPIGRDVTISVSKRDADTGAPLKGAVIEIIGCRSIYHETTDEMGFAHFTVQPCQAYCLREAVPPPGYMLDPKAYNAEVSISGDCYIDGVHVDSAVFMNTRAE